MKHFNLTKKCIESAFNKKLDKLNNKKTHLEKVFKYNGRQHNSFFKRSMDQLTEQYTEYITARDTLISHLDI